MATPARTASLSTSGFEDGLGRRTVLFDRAAGGLRERLSLRPEFRPYESSLRERVERWHLTSSERFATVHGIERDTASGALIVVSDLPDGMRVSDVLDAAAAGPASPDATTQPIDVAIGFLLQATAALSVLHAAGGFPHGAASAPHVFVTADGQVVFTDGLYAQVIEHLRFSRLRLWTELRVASPRVGRSPRLDAAGDLAQVSVTALALALGRGLRADDLDALPRLLHEVTDVAQIRGSARFANGLSGFLQRTLPLDGARGYVRADDALVDLTEVARCEMGSHHCRLALASFVRDLLNAPFPVEADQTNVAPSSPPTVSGACRAPGEPTPGHARPSVTVTPERPHPTAELKPVPATPPSVEAPEAAHVEEPARPAATSAVLPPRAQSPASPHTQSPGHGGHVAVDPGAVPGTQPELPAALAPTIDPRSGIADPTARIDAQETPALEACGDLAARAEDSGCPLLSESPAPVASARPPEPPPAEAPAIREVLDTPPIGEPTRIEDADPGCGAGATTRRPVAGDTEAAPATAMIDKHRPNPDDTAVSAAPPEPPLRMPVFTFGTAAVTPREIPVAAVAAPTSSTPSPAIAIRQGGTLFGTEPRASRTDDDFTAAGSSALAPSHVGRRHAWWKVAAGIVLAVLAGVAARRGYMPEGASAAAAPVVRLVTAPVEEKTAPPAPALATLELSSQPAGARVLLDGKEIGQTPLTRADVEPGRHVLTFITASASLNKTVRVKAGETLSVDVPVFSGWLVVFAPIRLDVSENGRGIGSSEDERLLLAPGRHTLTLRNAQLGYSTVETVNILPGEERRLTIAPRGTLNVNAVPWAEVWLDGERLGETPLANLQVPLGTRDIVFKHPEWGERRQTITVAAGAPTAVSVDFSKPPSP